jgi:hypothetical protein
MANTRKHLPSSRVAKRQHFLKDTAMIHVVFCLQFPFLLHISNNMLLFCNNFR